MKCGKNHFFEVVGSGGEGATPKDAEDNARKKANQLLMRAIRKINRFYDQDCPRDCPNQTVIRPEVYTLHIYTTYDAKTGNYDSLVAYVVRGQVNCN